jgi:photosystem II stability/assembly factor-like uncharacterized protein
MRKVYLSLLTFFLSVFLLNTSYSQIDLNWKWMHPKPQGNTFRYVKVFSATQWVAIGYAGAFMSTTNGGTSWTIYMNAGGTQTWGLGRSLYSGWFFSVNSGLVCGASGWIGKTTNGGASWDSIASGVTATLYGMHFINANTGFIGGTSGTVLKTTNAGSTWAAIPTGGTLSIYNIYAVDVNHIYAPTSSSGNILITTNGGTNWNTYATGGTTLYDANFGDANTGFVCGSSGHVKLTVNGGLNWTSINPASTSTFYDLTTTAISLPPSNLLSQNFEGTTYPPTGWTLAGTSGIWARSTACSGYGIGTASSIANFYSVSSGQQDLITESITSTITGDSLKFDHAYATYISEDDQMAISTSTDGGTTWTQLILLHGGVSGALVTAPPTTSNFVPTASQWATKKYALPVGTNKIKFTAITAYGNNLYIDNIFVTRPASNSYAVYVTGDAFYIYKSTNLGANWTSIDHLDPSQIWTSTWYSMDMNGNTMVAVGASGLINRSSNAGANWSTFSTWIFAGTFYDIWAEYNDGKVLAVGSGSNNTKILYSSNGGTTWIPRDIPTSKYFRSISMVNANTGYIAGSSGGMFKTTNGGANWDSLPFPSSSALLYRVDFVDASTGWTVSSSSPYLWKTVNGGQNWASQTGPTSATYCIDMVNANTGWIVGSSGAVRKTTDGGTTWNTQTSNYSSTLYWIKMIDVNSGYLCGAGGTLRKTVNGGTSWDTVATPYSTTHYGMDWKNMNNGILVGSSTGYTAKTSDGGQNWSIETTSGSTMYGVYMRANDSAWACGSIQGIYKWAKGMVGTVNWNSQVPTAYFLSQNYPNPFNPVTTIKFGLPKSGSVSLKVYDITGRVVAALFNNAPLNAGNVSYKFDGTNLASGIYFYTLYVDNNKIDTKKMVLVK